MPYKVDGKNCYSILIIWTSSGYFPDSNWQLELFPLHSNYLPSSYIVSALWPLNWLILKCSLADRLCCVLCSVFRHTRHEIGSCANGLWQNYHSNSLAIRVQTTSVGALAQFTFSANLFTVYIFHGDAINSNQYTFNEHYFVV